MDFIHSFLSKVLRLANKNPYFLGSNLFTLAKGYVDFLEIHNGSYNKTILQNQSYCMRHLTYNF